MSSGEESDSPRPTYSRGDSHKSLPHHDSLRELTDTDKKRRMKKKEEDDQNGDDRAESSSSNNNNNHKGQTDIDMINGSPQPQTPITSDSVELLENSGAERKNTLNGKGGDKDTLSKKTNIIAMGDIELQETGKPVAPLPPPKEKKKKSKKLKKLLRMKPKVVENKPRQIYFNNAVKNASFGYP